MKINLIFFFEFQRKIIVIIINPNYYINKRYSFVRNFSFY